MSTVHRRRGARRWLHGRAGHARRGERRLFAIVAIVTAVLTGFGGTALAYVTLTAAGTSQATAERLTPPTDLTATPNGRTVSLSWQDTAPWTSGATAKPSVGYVVYRCTGSGCTPKPTGNTKDKLVSVCTIPTTSSTTSCMDKSALSTTSYGYAVVAVYESWVSLPATTSLPSWTTDTPGNCSPETYVLEPYSTVDFTLLGAGGGNGGGLYSGTSTGGKGAGGAKVAGTLTNDTDKSKVLSIDLGCRGWTGSVPDWWWYVGGAGGGGGLFDWGGNGGGGAGYGGGGGGGGGASAIYLGYNLLSLAGGGGGGGGGVGSTPGLKGSTTYITSGSPNPVPGNHGADANCWYESCGGGGGGGGGVGTHAPGGSAGSVGSTNGQAGKGGSNGLSYLPSDGSFTTSTGVVVTLTRPAPGDNSAQNGAVQFVLESTTIPTCNGSRSTTLPVPAHTSATFALSGAGGGSGYGGGSGGDGAEVTGKIVNNTGSGRSLKVQVGCKGGSGGKEYGGAGGTGYANGGNGGGKKGNDGGHGGGGGGGASSILIGKTLVAVAGGGGGGSKSGAAGMSSVATEPQPTGEPGGPGADVSTADHTGGGGGGGGAGMQAAGGTPTQGGAGGYSYVDSSGTVTGLTVTVWSTIGPASNAGVTGSATFTDPPSTPTTVRTPVQSAGDSTAPGSSATVRLPTTVTAGDALVLSVGLAPGSGGVTSVAGGGVTWTEAASSPDAAIYYGFDSTGGTGTVTVTATGTITMANLSEWTGIDHLDSSVEASGIGGSVGAGSLPVAASHELVVSAGTIEETTGGTTSITAPYAELDIAGATLSDTAYLDSGAGATFTPSWAQVSSTEAWSALAVAFDSAGTATTATAPTVTSVSPRTGPATGGTSVTITGTNFTTTATVSFGATTAASVTVDSPTSITAVTPSHAAGEVTVTITTKNGNASVVDGFTYTTATTAPTATTGSKTTATTGSQSTASTATTGSTGTTAATASKTTAPTATTAATGSNSTTSKTTTSKTPKTTTPGTVTGTTPTGSTPA